MIGVATMYMLGIYYIGRYISNNTNLVYVYPKY